MIAFITIASVMFYLLAGTLAATRNLPRAWAEARNQWCSDEMVRTSVKARTVCMLLFWPFYIPARIVGVFFGHVIDSGDPEVIAAKVRKQQQRIAQLERDLGLR